MVSSGSGPPVADRSFAALRDAMVTHQIAARGVGDPLVLAAMRHVARENFLPERMREFAYDDGPVPIAGEQTMSQPYIVAYMAEALQLKGGERVLEIGCGSGYAAAVLAEIAAEVFTVERLEPLAQQAASTLGREGVRNVHVLFGDGTRGWPEHAPYDAIVVAAAGPQVPESLKAQLKVGGRLVLPVGADRRTQELVRITRMSEADFRPERLAAVRFVPLIGDEGWGSHGGTQ
jgi:protein-L-isoaspartate(D-aspartate) O-methyltransferase